MPHVIVDCSANVEHWVDRPALSGATLDTTSPVYESLICTVARGGTDDIDAATQAARDALPA